ncbi:hypothetical protein R3P38DRAFT_3224061 [Favolaschia claudopus]|uniref:Uncharacterized protein n=1 Tax=Favolaschia claudopus TaxID=2862362 RepID=A0AAV9ZCX8_9AGAR
MAFTPLQYVEVYYDDRWIPGQFVRTANSYTYGPGARKTYFTEYQVEINTRDPYGRATKTTISVRSEDLVRAV